jgi:hypothetical protein
MADRLGNRRELAAAQNALGMLYRLEGRLDEAEPIYRDVVRLVRELGDQEYIAIGLLNLAMVCIGRGVEADSRAMLLEVLQIADATGSQPVERSALEVCAGLAASEGDAATAARLFAAAQAQMATTGLRRDPADEAFLSSMIERARAAIDATMFAAEEAIGRQLSLPLACAQARAWLGDGRA